MDSATTHERLAQFRRMCREHGLVATVQRQAVFETLLEREDHPTVDQVYERIAERVPGISRTTAYRILDTFARLGLVTRICHPGSAARFDPKIGRHHHLFCVSCERIIDIEDDRLDRIQWPDVSACGFEIQGFDVHFHGLCADCRSRQGKKGGGAVRPSKQPKARKSVPRNRSSNLPRRTKP